MKLKEGLLIGMTLLVLAAIVTKAGRIMFSVLLDCIGLCIMLIGIVVIITAVLNKDKPQEKKKHEDEK